VTDSTEAWK